MRLKILLCALTVLGAQTVAATDHAPEDTRDAIQHYSVKVMQAGSVASEFTVDIARGATGVFQSYTEQQYVKSCDTTIGKKGSTTSLVPGTANEGINLSARDLSGGARVQFDIAITRLTAMRTLKSGDCEIQVPDMQHITESFPLDVGLGETVSRALGGGAFALVVTHKAAL